MASYDRASAQQALDHFRRNRRSATQHGAASTCGALGYEIDKKRGKGSHWVAHRAGAPTVTIPTVFGVRIATGILRTLEKVLDDDAADDNRDS
jgi:predicted RNA binding protein YcfA (HicA-like mRNA interferase family)